MIKLPTQFWLIDDDKMNNALSRMAIRRSVGEVTVHEFVIPEAALECIKVNCKEGMPAEKIVMLLDINMPTLDAWEFLEKFDKFSDVIKQQFNIYILSSSIDMADMERARANAFVIDFLEKPLKRAVLTQLLSGKNTDC